MGERGWGADWGVGKGGWDGFGGRLREQVLGGRCWGEVWGCRLRMVRVWGERGSL